MKNVISLFLIIIGYLYGVSQDTEWYYNNPNTNTFDISTTEDFKGFVYLVQNKITNFEGATINLKCNLDLTSYSNQVNLNCTFKGNGHTISNRRYPLFNTITENGVLEDLIIDSSCGISSGVDIGMFCITNKGNIRYCCNYATIDVSVFDDYSHVAGICALNYGSIIGCVNKGRISVVQGEYYKKVQRIGGIASYNQNATIANCKNEGNISLTTKYYGMGAGIAGDLQHSNVISCINSGDVTVRLADSNGISANDIILYSGGITGQAQVNSKIDQCINYATIKSNAEYVGGIAGQVSHTSLSNLVNYGSIQSIESSFYSCAAGITGFCRNVNYKKPFINCVNLGTISAYAKTNIATAAGICMEIHQSTVANLLNIGTISANASGNLSNKFYISQYETKDCDILNTANSIADLQDFVSANHIVEDIELNNWSLENDNVSMDNNAQKKLEPGFTNTNVFILSEKIDPTSNILITTEDNKSVCTHFFSSKSFTIEDLMPDELYKYTITSGEIVKSGQFHTKKPTVSIQSNKPEYLSTKIVLSSDCPLDHIDFFGAYYRQDTPSEYKWTKISNNINSISITNLLDDKPYLIRPFIKIKGKEFSNVANSFQTNKIVPVFTLTNATLHSLEFVCDNYEDIKSFNPSLQCADSTYSCNELGNVLITNLKYGQTYDCKITYKSPEGEKSGNKISASTINDGTDKCLQISPQAAMVQGVIYNYGRKAPNGKNFTNCRFEYRKIDDHIDVPSKFVDAILIDDNTCFAATIPFESNGIYQYRTYVDNTYNPNSSYYNKLVGEWIVANKNNSQTSSHIVIPKFFNIKSNKGSIKCCLVPGEENIIASGMEYNIENVEQKTRTSDLTLSLDLFSSQLSYYGRYYAETKSGIYYSELFRFNGSGEINFIKNSDTPNDSNTTTLTIYSPNDGKIILTDLISFTIEAPKGASFNTITLNDVDISDKIIENAIEVNNLCGKNELSYSLKYQDDVIEEVKHNHNKTRVYAKDCCIHIESSNRNDIIRVYDTKGTTIYEGKATAIPVPIENIYIVSIGSNIYKLFVR